MKNTKKDKKNNKTHKTMDFASMLEAIVFPITLLLDIILSLIFKQSCFSRGLHGKYQKTTKENLIEDIKYGIVALIITVICCKLYVIYSS